MMPTFSERNNLRSIKSEENLVNEFDEVEGNLMVSAIRLSCVAELTVDSRALYDCVYDFACYVVVSI